MKIFRPSPDRLNNSHTKLLLRGDTIADASPNARSITNTGTVTSVAAPGGHPYAKTAGYFNGSSNISAPTSSDFNFSSGAFTIRFWMYLPSIGVSYSPIGRVYGSSPFTGWCIFIRQTGSLELYSNTNTLVFASATGVIAPSKWQFIQMSSNGTTVSFHVDGVSIGTWAGILQEYAIALLVGASQAGSIVGNMCDVEVSQGIQRSSEVPTSPIIPDAYTKLHLPMMEYTGQQVVKETVQNKIPTGTSLDLVQQLPANGGPALDRVFFFPDSTARGITLPNSTDWQFGTGDFTIEFWTYWDGTAIVQVPMSFGLLHGYYAFNFGQRANGTYAFQTSSAGTAWDGVALEAGVLPSNSWVHVAVTRSGSTFRIYFNGVFKTKQTSTLAVFAATQPLSIGADQDLSSPIRGKLGWVHVVKGTALYTTETSFTPPTSPQKCSNTKAIILPGDSPTLFMDKSSSTAPKAITVTGAKQMLLPGGGKALIFSGSNYLSASYSPDWYFPGDVTFDFWINATSLDGGAYGYIPIISQLISPSSYQMLILYPTGAFSYARSLSENSYALSSGPNSQILSDWNHMAFVVSNNIGYIFVNGILKESSTITTSPIDYGADLTIGHNIYGQNLAGKIEDLRISKGVALWTKNFIPPSRTL